MLEDSKTAVPIFSRKSRMRGGLRAVAAAAGLVGESSPAHKKQNRHLLAILLFVDSLLIAC